MKFESIQRLKDVFNAILAEKAALKREIAEIHDLELFSGEAKLAMQRKAEDNTRIRLAEICVEAEKLVEKLQEEIGIQNRFDYADPKLVAAISFIQTSGTKMPEQAWQQIVEDFDGRPSELFYLSKLFDENSLFEAAQAAKESAQQISLAESFPRRLDDYLYFVTASDPACNADFSGFVAEMDRIAGADAGEEE